jgi:hypothetical protein
MQTDIENVRWLELGRYQREPLVTPRRLAGMFVLAFVVAALLWLGITAAVMALV